MNVIDIKNSVIKCQWNHYNLSYNIPTYDVDGLIEQCHPHIYVNQLNESTYKELAILIDPNFLKQGIRSSVLNGIRLQDINEDTMNFRINSSEYKKNGIRYLCRVKFDQWNEVGQDSEFKNANEKARILLWAGDIRLDCNCPSFLYWGYQYILTVLDAAINNEPRKPIIRNPGERGIVCKHLNRIMKALPFYNGDIASAIKRQFGS